MRRLILAAAVTAALSIAVAAPVAAAGQSSLADLRTATAAFHDIAAAKAAGYTVEVADLAGITCIADPGGAGTMGIHFLNPSLLDDTVNATTPELVIYAPGPDGRLQLVAVEYLVIQAAWDAANASPPALFGETFHLVAAGNRYGLPAFYELHAWVWQPNPNGMFYEWNPRISC
ncbi:MAG TPA: hypothetical protein VJ506_09545 [Candidatus Limnocylindrales bacterium]|nr:hypothetical protein [Candidatus Limnocylindrales bacterium]